MSKSCRYVDAIINNLTQRPNDRLYTLRVVRSIEDSTLIEPADKLLYQLLICGGDSSTELFDFGIRGWYGLEEAEKELDERELHGRGISAETVASSIALVPVIRTAGSTTDSRSLGCEQGLAL